MEKIETALAPAAIGPYSQAIKAGNLVFTSGQLALDTATGALVGATITEQSHQALKNLGHVLTEAGATYSNVAKTTCFLRDMSDFAAFNAVYNQYFTAPYPARSCFAVKSLPKDALVEIEAVAVLA